MTSESGFSLTQVQDGDQTVLQLSGELDLVSAPELSAAIASTLSSGQRVRVDLTDVSFVDSSGLAAIVTSAQDRETRARVSVAPSKHAQPNRLLEITGIAALLSERPVL